MIKVFEDSGFGKDVRSLPSFAQIKLARCLKVMSRFAGG